jgi:hypothetical protein
MAELGETNDPTALVPGSAGDLQATAQDLSSYGDTLHEAGAGLKRIDTAEGWSGKAADQFRDVFHGQPTKWLEAGDSFHAASKAVTTYSSTLTWAQGQAETAIRQWNQAQAATKKAKEDHAKAPPNTPFNDPGDAGRNAAQGTLARARHQLDSAGNTAAGTVDKAKDKAPPEPGFWSKVGSGISDVAGDVGHGLANFGKEAVNVLASTSNAALHHPLAACGVAAGALLTVVSAGGEGIGGALDITGVGTVPGLALGAVSTGGIVLGASTVAASATSLAMSAAGEDHVQVFNTDSSDGGGETAPGEAPPFEAPKEISGRTAHGEERMQGTRGDGGVTDNAANDAVQNPVKPPQYRPDSQGGVYRYPGKDAVVNLNKDGEVVSTWPKSEAGRRIPR